jgi:hypothetical protein
MAALVGRAAVGVVLILVLAELAERGLQGKALLVARPQVLQIMVQAVVVVLLESVQTL